MTTPIYIFNKYYILYHNIISMAISQDRYKSKDQYYENHHIIPKSFSGSNNKDNLILLTTREHYICHYLLTKFTTDIHKYKMIYAFNFMNISKNHKINSKLFESNKIKLNKIPRPKNIRDKISNTMKNRIFSKEHKRNISKSQVGKLNHHFRGYFHTPWGIYESALKSSQHTTISDVTIGKWCKHQDKIISKQSICKSKYLKTLKYYPLGKTFKDIGFYLIPE